MQLQGLGRDALFLESVAGFSRGSQALNPETVLFGNFSNDSSGGTLGRPSRSLQRNHLIAGCENPAEDLLAFRVIGELGIAAQIGVFEDGLDGPQSGTDSFDDFAFQPDHIGSG